MTERTLPPPDRLWPRFPHCGHCDELLWAVTDYRHKRDPRGPLLLPTQDGYCPHCGADIYRAVP